MVIEERAEALSALDWCFVNKFGLFMLNQMHIILGITLETFLIVLLVL